MGFSFDISDFVRFAKDIDNLAKKAEAREALGPKLSGQEYSNDVKAIAPLGSMPGESHGDYRRAIHAEMSQENGHPVCFVGTNKIQAKQLEFGGSIKAKNAPYLVFKTYDGDWVRTKEVFQPGVPHFRPAFDNNKEKYDRIMIAAFKGEVIDIDIEFGNYSERKRFEYQVYATSATNIRPDLMGRAV
jgi:hypothetical protein